VDEIRVLFRTSTIQSDFVRSDDPMAEFHLSYSVVSANPCSFDIKNLKGAITASIDFVDMNHCIEMAKTVP
jgi:hypothetical protein